MNWDHSSCVRLRPATAHAWFSRAARLTGHRDPWPLALTDSRSCPFGVNCALPDVPSSGSRVAPSCWRLEVNHSFRPPSGPPAVAKRWPDRSNAMLAMVLRRRARDGRWDRRLTGSRVGRGRLSVPVASVPFGANARLVVRRCRSRAGESCGLAFRLRSRGSVPGRLRVRPRAGGRRGRTPPRWWGPKLRPW